MQINVLHFLNFFRISKPRSNFGQRKFVQTLWTRQKVFSFNQKVRSEMVMWFDLSPSLVVQEKTIFGSSFTKKIIYSLETQKKHVILNIFRQNQCKHSLAMYDAPMCQISGHLNKLCHGYAHELPRLAQKPRTFYLRVHFSKEFFELFRISQVS